MLTKISDTHFAHMKTEETETEMKDLSKTSVPDIYLRETLHFPWLLFQWIYLEEFI